MFKFFTALVKVVTIVAQILTVALTVINNHFGGEPEYQR